ncbi:MAG: hypothetical protein KHY08_10375 [Lachnospiraceae bacterium]|nr:hypothetical protein [Lachnospiraceae bacterium]
MSKEKQKKTEIEKKSEPRALNTAGGYLADRERMLKDLEQLTLLSDVFMSVVLSDLGACQHVVRILTGDHEIRLKSVRTQYVISKAVTRGARLDVLAEEQKSTLYHLEIENTDTMDHPRRTRFYGALTDSELLRKGAGYSALPDRRIFYISRTDIWKNGYTVYEEEKRFRQTGLLHEDGAHVTYVNATVDDGSRIAKLMRYFRTADPFDDSEGALSKRVRFLKTEEGGREIMCEIMEKIREEGRKEGRKSGFLESSRKTALNLNRMGMPEETIARAVEEDVTVVRQWLKSAK